MLVYRQFALMKFVSHCMRNITQSTDIWKKYRLQICGLTINIYSFPTELCMYDLNPGCSHLTRRMQFYLQLSLVIIGGFYKLTLITDLS